MTANKSPLWAQTLIYLKCKEELNATVKHVKKYNEKIQQFVSNM